MINCKLIKQGVNCQELINATDIQWAVYQLSKVDIKTVSRARNKIEEQKTKTPINATNKQWINLLDAMDKHRINRGSYEQISQVKL